MAFIDWSDTLSVEFEEVNDDHKKLRANSFYWATVDLAAYIPR